MRTIGIFMVCTQGSLWGVGIVLAASTRGVLHCSSAVLELPSGEASPGSLPRSAPRPGHMREAQRYLAYERDLFAHGYLPNRPQLCGRHS